MESTVRKAAASTTKKSAVILGAGNWGTTLAVEFSHCCHVRLWTENESYADAIGRYRENRQFLPGVRLPRSIKVEPKFSSELHASDWLVMAVPSSQMVPVCRELKSRIHRGQIVINVSKGVVSDNLKTMSEIIEAGLSDIHLVVLTGPTIAREVAAGEPARAVLACQDVATLLQLRKHLRLPHLSFEMSRDVKGSELCAALKGIVAIGVGIAEGLNLHSNIQSVIMTYGLNEFRKIAEFFHIPEKTIYGLPGMGDLIATCISPDSRNRRFGKLLGQGVPLHSALKKVGMVVEGVSMAKTIVELAHFNLDIPLFKCVSRIIFEAPKDVHKELTETLKAIN
jgi:glycerol-3-phosphate dehydrogenase (NAD(P)+)